MGLPHVRQALALRSGPRGHEVRVQVFPSVLAVYLVSQMNDAIREIPVISGDELNERFIAWAR